MQHAGRHAANSKTRLGYGTPLRHARLKIKPVQPRGPSGSDASSSPLSLFAQSTDDETWTKGHRDRHHLVNEEVRIEISLRGKVFVTL
eukprot:scaffold55383_cov51-Attheya_sp.AAC.2